MWSNFESIKLMEKIWCRQIRKRGKIQIWILTLLRVNVEHFYRFVHILNNTPIYYCTHFHRIKAFVILCNQYTTQTVQRNNFVKAVKKNQYFLHQFYFKLLFNKILFYQQRDLNAIPSNRQDIAQTIIKDNTISDLLIIYFCPLV